MAASKVDEVGQMRRRRGTSMKRIMKEDTLERLHMLVGLTLAGEGPVRKGVDGERRTDRGR